MIDIFDLRIFQTIHSLIMILNLCTQNREKKNKEKRKKGFKRLLKTVNFIKVNNLL